MKCSPDWGYRGFEGFLLMAGYICCLLIILSVAAAAAPSVLIDTDFSKAGREFHVVSADRKKEINGRLPLGWSDNSDWNEEIGIDYRLLSEGDRPFARMSRFKGGRAQLSHHLGKLEEGYYRLRMSARSDEKLLPELGIRLVSSPYSWVWMAQPLLSREWHEYSYLFRLGTQNQDVGVWINIGDESSLDFSGFRLEKLSEADIIDEAKKASTGNLKGNQLTTTRFPMGLPLGWAVDRDYSDEDDVRIIGDRGVPGPSGSPSMKVYCPSGVKIYSAPFKMPVFDQFHTLSLYMKGSGGGEISVLEDGRKIAGQYFAGSNGWERIAINILPDSPLGSYSLQFEMKGTVWLDGLQLEQGLEPSRYSKVLPYEVALGLPKSDASVARVQFDDEPARIHWCVTGNKGLKESGAVLKAKAIDLYDEEILLPEVALKSGAFDEGDLIYGVFAKHPYGSFRIEAWVEDAGGAVISPVGEFVVNRVRRPRYWGKDAPDSPFGVHTNSTTRHIQMAKAMGFNWIRLHDAGTQYIGWSFLEPQKGEWNFHDKELARYRKWGMKILGLVSTAPGWATNLGYEATGYFDRYLEPLDMADWSNYVKTVVSRYKNMIDTYEVWNEPWGNDFWAWQRESDDTGSERSKTAVQDYARLQKSAFEAAHYIMPGVRIAGFNTTSDKIGSDWTAGVMANGGLQTCDLITYHYYTSGLDGAPGDGAGRAFGSALGPVVEKNGGVPKPVWMSEGSPVNGRTEKGMYRSTVPFGDDEDSFDIGNRLCRYSISTLAQGVQKLFLYSMHCHSGYFTPGSNDWRALVTDDGYLHPAATAYAAMTWLLEDTSYVRTTDLANGVHAFIFKGSDRAVAVLSADGKHGAVTLGVLPEITATDLFGNPVEPGTQLGGDLVYLTAGKGLDYLESQLARLSP